MQDAGMRISGKNRQQMVMGQTGMVHGVWRQDRRVQQGREAGPVVHACSI